MSFKNRISILIYWLAVYLFLFPVIFIGCVNSPSHTYYVSEDGNDYSDGTFENPFKSISLAASFLKSGDTLFIRSGEYFETLKINFSGSELKPIVISNYQDEKVVFYGLDRFDTNWSQASKNLWVTNLPNDLVEFSNFQIFRGSQNLVEARWPNMPNEEDMSAIGEYGPYRAVAQQGTNKDGVVALQVFNEEIIGGGICVWPGEHGASAWGPKFRDISGVADGKILFNEEMTSEFFSGIDPYTPYPGNAFFLFGSMQFLDNKNEFYLDEDKHQLYLLSEHNPAEDNIKIKKRDVGLLIDSVSHVVINGLNFIGATLNASNINEVVVQNCTFLYPEYLRYPHSLGIKPRQGMSFIGNNSQFINNEVAFSSVSGLFVQGSNIKIVNNYIHDIATTGIGSGVFIGENSEYLLLANNSIVRSGRSHFLCQGGSFGEGENKFNEKHIEPAKIKEVIMEYNYLQDHNTYTSDCALFYAWNVDGGGTKFRYNYCTETLKENGEYKYTNGALDRQIQGLYSDNFCKNMEFSSNIVINATTGIQANNFNENIIDFNNTIINPTKEMVATYGYNETPGYMKGCRIFNNDFFTTDSTKNIYLGIHCDRGTFENPGELRQEYIKQVSFAKGKTITSRYDLPDNVFAYTVAEQSPDSTFEIRFDQHDPALRNAESKGNKLFTSPKYGKPEFYENYFKLPSGEILSNYGSSIHKTKINP
jgi:hypothetical protein